MAYPPQAPPPQYPQQPHPQQKNGLAVTAMVLGIIAVPGICLPIANWILAILAIIFGGVGLRKSNQGAPGKGMAIAGLVLGVIMLAILVVLTILGQAYMDTWEAELENL